MMTYKKGLAAISLVAGIALFSSAADARAPAGVNCDADQKNNIQAAVDAAKPGDTIFISGTCNEDVSITKDDITLSGNEAGIACNKADPSLSAAAMIDGTITVDGVRAKIEFLVITGSGSAVDIINRADVHLTCNDISDNEKWAILVRRSSNAVLRDNMVSGNGTREANPFIFFDVGLFAAGASSVFSVGNTYKDNQYAAIEIDRQSSFRNGSFLARENGHGPIPGERDIIIQKGVDPSNPATCKTNGGPFAVTVFNDAQADFRNADICGRIDATINSSIRIDDAGGEIIGNASVSRGSWVRIKDRSGFGDGRLTTFDGTLNCSGFSGTFGSDVQCGQTCTGAIPGSCVGP